MDKSFTSQAMNQIVTNKHRDVAETSSYYTLRTLRQLSVQLQQTRHFQTTPANSFTVSGKMLLSLVAFADSCPGSSFLLCHVSPLANPRIRAATLEVRLMERGRHDPWCTLTAGLATVAARTVLVVVFRMPILSCPNTGVVLCRWLWGGFASYALAIGSLLCVALSILVRLVLIVAAAAVAFSLRSVVVRLVIVAWMMMMMMMNLVIRALSVRIRTV